MKKICIAILLIFCCLDSKIYLITTAFNKPEFIGYQYRTFKKFITDDHEFVVFDDSTSPDFEKRIQNECLKFNIRYFKIPQELHKCNWPDDIAKFLNSPNSLSAPFRHSDGVQYAMDTIGYTNDDVVAIVDSDLFAVRSFSIKEYLDGYSIAGKAAYYPPNVSMYPLAYLVFLDVPNLPDIRSLIFKAGLLSYTYLEPFMFMQFYLHSHPQVKFKDMMYFEMRHLLGYSTQDMQGMGIEDAQLKFVINFIDLLKVSGKHNMENDGCGFYENAFLNLTFGRGETDFVRNKIKLTLKYLDEILSN